MRDAEAGSGGQRAACKKRRAARRRMLRNPDSSLQYLITAASRRFPGAVTSVAATVLLLAVSVLSAGSCAKTTRRIAAPPAIAGATFAGSESCADCHDEQSESFAAATHSILGGSDAEAGDLACESCHGAGSLHVESGGESDLIINPRKSPRVCFACHLDKRAEFSLPYSHPVGSGPLGLGRSRISCSDCHQPHSPASLAWGAESLRTRNDACLDCHPAQRGPFVFEHEALRDGCTVCHEAHGSVNDKLLTERNSALCLKCHSQQQSLSGDRLVIGGRGHNSELSRGTCFSAGCHEAVHGSQVNSSLLY